MPYLHLALNIDNYYPFFYLDISPTKFTGGSLHRPTGL